ncbi:helix-turn-helix domain-containing protein [Vibrio astriarenae]
MLESSKQRQIRLSSTQNLTPFIDYCEENDINWQRIARICDMPTDVLLNRDWLLSRHIMRFVDMLEREIGPSVGVEIGQRFEISSIKKLTDIIESSQCVTEALNQLVEFMTSMNNHVLLWTEFIDGQWWLCHRNGHKPTTPGVSQAEWYRTCQMITFCREFFGASWAPKKIKVMGMENTTVAKQYFAQSQVEFDCAFGAITIEMKGKGEFIKGIQNPWDIKGGITKLVQSYALLPWFTIEWFSNILGTTPRTLQRELKKQSLSFKQLKEQTRKEHATQLLATSTLPTSDVAWESGYSDLSNFNRAFKTWTGMTPSMYRKQHRASST